MVPETLPIVNTVALVVDLMTALVSVQLPVLAVTQLTVPPGEKVARTVALATAALVLMLRIAAVACARQSRPALIACPLRDFTAITGLGASVGLPPASVYSSRLGEPLPIEPSRLAVALDVRKVATAAGDAAGLDSRTSAAARRRAAWPSMCR